MSSTISLPSRTKAGSRLSFAGHPLRVTRGHPLPLGANVTPGGVNFVLICRHATAVWLVLSEPCDGEIYTEIPLDPRKNRTGDHWHIRVDGLPEEFCYGYRVDGPKATATDTIPGSSCSTRHPGHYRAAGPGARAGTCRAAAW